jgi:DNA-binding IclR family transcriptional regulator
MSEQEGVAAVDRALSILDALTDERVGLAEIAKRTGLYKSTVLRLIKSLERGGYVLRLADGNYRLGSKVLLLGALYQRYFSTADLVPPVLARLAAEVGEGASFYVCEGDQRVCLHRVETTRAIRDSVHVGDRLALTVGAAGHVLRAFSGESGARMDEIRQRMYGASYGERDAETAAVAVPVFGPQLRLMGALSVSGPRYRLEEMGEEKLVAALFRHARQLTATFGGNADDPALAGWSPSAARGRGGASAAPRTAARRARGGAAKADCGAFEARSAHVRGTFGPRSRAMSARCARRRPTPQILG